MKPIGQSLYDQQQLQQIRGAGLAISMAGAFLVSIALAIEGHSAVASICWGGASFLLTSAISFAIEGQSR